MGNVRIELNKGAVQDLLVGPEVKALIEQKCAAIAATASASGGEFGHDVILGARRAHGMVWTDDYAARRAEAKDRALTRAIDAGR